MARREQFKVSKVELALRESGGIFTAAAKMLGCAPNTVKGYVARHPTLQAALEETVEVNLDICEHNILTKAIKEKDISCSLAYLRAKGRSRGWAPTLAVDAKHSGTVEVKGKVRLDVSGASLDEIRTWSAWEDGTDDPDDVVA